MEGGVHPLDRASFERLKRILIERLRWSRSANAWSDVILWADLMLRLFTASASVEFATPENAVIAKLQKVGTEEYVSCAPITIYPLWQNVVLSITALH